LLENPKLKIFDKRKGLQLKTLQLNPVNKFREIRNMRTKDSEASLNIQRGLSESLNSLLSNPYLWVILISFSIRIVTLDYYPIGDTTEARYSEITRMMLESGDWISLKYINGEPFWGKPPLLFWLQATSFKVFGISEFSARLPSIFISLFVVGLVFYIAKIQFGRTQAWIASALLSTNVLFYILSGSVLMEPLLLLSTTLSMVAFWQVIRDRERYWGYLFFVGLAIGLMSKGPLAGVLITMPVITWLITSDNWRNVMQRIPLFTGTILMLALTLPWYLLAEHATPGFLNYYIIGEHWERFTTADWQGNQFGTTHSSYIGAIWVEWLLAAFPMSLILIIALFTLIKRKKSAALPILREDFSRYLILWIITLLLFFTFTKNTTIIYVFTSLPATALLVAKLWQIKSEKNNKDSNKTRKSIARITIISVLFPFFFLAVVFFYMPYVADRNTEKFLVENYQKLNSSGKARLIYLFERPASAQYYSRGKAEVISSTNKIIAIVKQEPDVFLAISVGAFKNTPENIKQCLLKIGRFGRYILFQGNKQNCNS